MGGGIGTSTFPTPSNARRVDVVVTLSFAYRTSAGDSGRIDAMLGRARGNPLEMPPGEMPFATSTQWTSTSVMWVLHDLPGAGRTYSFLAEADLHDDGDMEGIFTTKKILVVVDIWPAGAH